MIRGEQELLIRAIIALERIAEGLEGLLESTNPVNVVQEMLPEQKDTVRTFYTDENRTIVEEKLHKMGKEYKERG